MEGPGPVDTDDSVLGGRAMRNGSAGRWIGSLILALAALSLAAPAARAQIFGQYTTAAISPLGEGAPFFSAGDGRLRAGLATRFLITQRSDLGLQAGYDRTEEIDNYGIGGDYKFYIINEDPMTRIDLSADVGLGWLGGSDYSRGLLTISFMVSGMIDPEAAVRVEPYGSVGFIGQYFFSSGGCSERRPGSWPCAGDDSSALSDLLFRGGAKIWLSDDYQVYVEFDYFGNAAIGAALNAVF
jgi:hypothetical protein